MSNVYPKLTHKHPPPKEENEDFVINVLPPEEVVKPEIVEEPVEQVVENQLTYSPKQALKRRLFRKPKVVQNFDYDYSPVFIRNPFQKLMDFLTVKPKFRQNLDFTYAPDYSYSTDETYAPYYSSTTNETFAPAYALKEIYKPRQVQKRTLIYDPHTSEDYDFNKDYYLQPLVVDELVPNANTGILKYAPDEEIKIKPETVFEVNIKPSPPQFINTIYYKLMGRLFNA